MSRVPLDDLCLTIKALGLGKAAPVLAEALEPPEASAVKVREPHTIHYNGD